MLQVLYIIVNHYERNLLISVYNIENYVHCLCQSRTDHNKCVPQESVTLCHKVQSVLEGGNFKHFSV